MRVVHFGQAFVPCLAGAEPSLHPAKGTLHNVTQLADKFVKNLVTPGQVKTLINYVEPLEKVKAEVTGETYDPSTFDYFKKLFGFSL